MKHLFKPGDKKTHQVEVKSTDVAAFENGMVHPFYATFALGRDAEWSSRLFVLDMKEEDEEGIGTHFELFGNFVQTPELRRSLSSAGQIVFYFHQ